MGIEREGLTGTALEAPENRRLSPIGVAQRHYHLDPVLITPDGVCTGVVIIAGMKATYVYPSDSDGNIADYAAVAVAPPGTWDDDVLAVMGYCVGADAGQLRSF